MKHKEEQYYLAKNIFLFMVLWFKFNMTVLGISVHIRTNTCQYITFTILKTKSSVEKCFMKREFNCYWTLEWQDLSVSFFLSPCNYSPLCQSHKAPLNYFEVCVYNMTKGEKVQ